MGELIDKNSVIRAVQKWRRLNIDSVHKGTYEAIMRIVRDQKVYTDMISKDEAEEAKKSGTKTEKTDCFAWRKFHICAALTEMNCDGCRFYKKIGTVCDSCPRHHTIYCNHCRNTQALY